MSQVTVVIPTYNAPVFLVDALRSVMRQTFRDFTCVVVDDGSTDDTVDRVKQIIASDTRFSIVTQQNAGPSAARNRGAEVSHSEFLAFLDCDDLWHERFLEVLVSAIGNGPAAHCVTQGIDSGGAECDGLAEWSRSRRRAVTNSKVIVTPVSEPTTFQDMVTAICIASPGAAIVRRSCFESMGRFDPSRRIHEDWDFWIRLSRVGPFRFVDETLFFYRRHTSNRHLDWGWEERREGDRLRRLVIAAPDNSQQERVQARMGARAFYRDHGKQALARGGPTHRLKGLIRIAYAYAF